MPARWTAHLVLVYEVAATKGTGCTLAVPSRCLTW